MSNVGYIHIVWSFPNIIHMYIRLARVYRMYINQTIYTHIKTLPYYVNRKLTSADSWLWNPSPIKEKKRKKITSANTTKIIILTGLR